MSLESVEDKERFEELKKKEDNFATGIVMTYNTVPNADGKLNTDGNRHAMYLRGWEESTQSVIGHDSYGL